MKAGRIPLPAQAKMGQSNVTITRVGNKQKILLCRKVVLGLSPSLLPILVRMSIKHYIFERNEE